MQNALNNIILSYKPYIVLWVALFISVPASGQKNIDTADIKITYLPPEQSKLVILPQKYLLSPQVDLIMGTSRVAKGDRTGIGYSATSKGIYQLGHYWHVNMGMGFTRLNSRREGAADSLPDSIHYSNILHLPLGLSFIMGDDRAQIITTLDFLPCYNAGSSDHSPDQKMLSWGTSTEFGFLFRFRRHWYTGLTGKLQVFKPFDRDISGPWPQYGFAGVGIMVRFSY